MTVSRVGGGWRPTREREREYNYQFYLDLNCVIKIFTIEKKIKTGFLSIKKIMNLGKRSVAYDDRK